MNLLLYFHSCKESIPISMEALYAYMGWTRQGFHQALKRQRSEIALVDKLKPLIRKYRQDKDRRAGARSLYYNLAIKKKYDLGVNKFEHLLSKYGLNVVPLKVQVVTTQSSLQSWNYDNLLNGLTINNINQAVVGDITYINIGKIVYYLFCLTDIYSARIVGYCCSKRMRSIEAKQALDQWIKLRKTKVLKDCIHHTDGGKQYFSKLYLQTTKPLGIRTSVASNCLENGYAEQRNALLKYHLIPTIDTSSEHLFLKELKRVFYFYNHKRKQKALNWKTPVEYEQYIMGLPQTPKKQLYHFMDSIQGV